MKEGYKISIKETGDEFFCQEGDFVLKALLSSGKSRLSNGCSGGGCGVCRSKVEKGQYSVEKKMSKAHVTDEDREEGWALLCCIKPKSDLLLSGVGTKKNGTMAFAGLMPRKS